MTLSPDPPAISEKKAALAAEIFQLNQELSRTRTELRDILDANNSIAAALFRSEERLRLIIDTIPAQISYFDKNQIYRYANKVYSNWFDLPASKVIGASILEVIGPKAYETILPYIARALSGETVTHEFTLDHHGKPVDARSTLVPEFGSDGTPIGCFEFSFDITETRRMQTALAQAQKMEAIGQLTGGIAHDFNNLLTIISGNLSILKERNPEQQAMLQLLDPAISAARRGAQLVRSLLSFSRQQPLKPTVINFGTLMTEMETLIRHSLPSSIQFHIQLPDTPLYLCTDPGQLESALLNFALNSRDAMPEGGQLAIRARSEMLNAQQSEAHKLPPGSYVFIEVSDTGCGMDEATLNKVFDPFFTTKSFGHGSGLGLSMIYGFARQSGGGIKVLSKPGMGSVFTLLLPSAKVGGIEEPPPEEQDQAAPAIGALALLVEDEPDVRQVVRNQLLDLGYAVLEAENSLQAKEILSQLDNITVLLTDIIMPGGKNGRELAQEALKTKPGLHIILMSGYEDQAGLTQNETDFCLLGKPFTRRELANALKMQGAFLKNCPVPALT